MHLPTLLSLLLSFLTLSTIATPTKRDLKSDLLTQITNTDSRIDTYLTLLSPTQPQLKPGLRKLKEALKTLEASIEKIDPQTEVGRTTLIALEPLVSMVDARVEKVIEEGIVERPLVKRGGERSLADDLPEILEKVPDDIREELEGLLDF